MAARLTGAIVQPSVKRLMRIIVETERRSVCLMAARLTGVTVQPSVRRLIRTTAGTEPRLSAAVRPMQSAHISPTARPKSAAGAAGQVMKKMVIIV